MDYTFFEALTDEEARTYLVRYLEVEAAATNVLLREARSAGVAAGYSLESLPAVFHWLGKRIRVVTMEPPPDAGYSIVRAMEEHHGGFRDFDERSRALVLRASYYLGQTFVSSFPALAWSVGRRDRAEMHQPVVTGFRTGADLPSLVVAENLLLTVGEPGYEHRVRTATDAWADVA